MSVTSPPAVAPAPVLRRHAWGWPAGSIRALLALGVLGLLWFVALYHPKGETVAEADKHLPMLLISLQILMVLMLVHFFTAHGKTIGRHVSTASPLGFPAGSIRFVLAAGYIGLCVLLFYNHADFALPEHMDLWPILLVIIVVLAAYFAGMILTAVITRVWGDPPPAPYQDLEAWVSMLAMVGLVVIVLIALINNKVSAEYQIPLDTAQAVVSGLIGLYFGARS